MKRFSWRFPGRFPWITVALVALCVAVSRVPGAALEYDRALVEAGEVWRLLTGQLVHWTARMAAFDLGMLLGLGIWLEGRGDRRLAAVTLALGGGLTALAVHALSPDLLVYRGSSGVASALFVLAAVRVANSPDPWTRAPGIAAVGLFLAKAAFESLARQSLFAGPLPHGVHVFPLVHLLGGLGGLVGSRSWFPAETRSCPTLRAGLLVEVAHDPPRSSDAGSVAPDRPVLGA